MDDFCQYNLFRKPRPPLFIPPPYARKSDGRGDRKQTPTLHLRATDPSKILLLCESLKDECTLDLEAKINCYLMAEADCEFAFISSMHVLPSTAVIKLIGIHALEPELQISTTDHTIAHVMKNKHGASFSVHELPEIILEQLQAIKPGLEGDVVAFPIYEQKHKNGIVEETEIVTHLVFTINSSNQQMFLGHMIQECFRFVLPILSNTAALERQIRVKNKFQQLLQMLHMFFSYVDNKDKLLECIIEQAKSMFESERCDIYFLDQSRKNLEGNIICNGKKIYDTLPKNEGILGYVCTNNKALNVSDAYQNPLFIKEDDRKCNYKTRNIFCFPLCLDEKVMGCVQMRNKNFGEFNVYDENTVEYFAESTALAVHICDTFRERQAEHARYDISSKLLLFHYDFEYLDVEHLLYAVRHHVEGFEFPSFSPRTIPKHRMPVVLMKMFEDLGLVKMFKLERKMLAKFIILMEKGYFNHPYHNFAQAFASTHFIYSTVCYLQLIQKKVLSELEVMALLIAAISHNVDHKGRANCYRTLEDSTLASLYSSDNSVMESYHFTQTMNVLNTEDCNFLVNLPLEDYAWCLELVKHNIISTDYTEHLKHCKQQEILLARSFRPRVIEHKLLFCSLLMTCADFSDQLRDWTIVRQVAADMYQEYFKVGELEHEMGKMAVDEDAEPERGRVPMLFISFIKDVCLPPFQLLGSMYPDMQFCVDALYDTITNWELAKPHFFNRDPREVKSLDMLLANYLSVTNLLGDEEECDDNEESNFFDEDDK